MEPDAQLYCRLPCPSLVLRRAKTYHRTCNLTQRTPVAILDTIQPPSGLTDPHFTQTIAANWDNCLGDGTHQTDVRKTRETRGCGFELHTYTVPYLITGRCRAETARSDWACGPSLGGVVSKNIYF